MDKKCYICKQSRLCCRQPLLEIGECGHHERFVHPVKGVLKDAWGLGSVWVTCCQMYYGLYYDDETKTCKPVFLGGCEQQAMSRVNHVKSFVADLSGR